MAAVERWERVGATALFAVGVAAAIVGAGYGMTRDTGAIGPGVMPLFAGGLLALGSLVVLLRVGRSDRQAPAAATGPGDHTGGDAAEATTRDRGTSLRQVVLTLVIMAVGAGLMSLIGFVIAAAAMVLSILLAVERVALWRAIVVTVVITTALWLVVHFLLIPVPAGPFFLAGGR